MSKEETAYLLEACKTLACYEKSLRSVLIDCLRQSRNTKEKLWDYLQQNLKIRMSREDKYLSVALLLKNDVIAEDSVYWPTSQDNDY